MTSPSAAASRSGAQVSGEASGSATYRRRNSSQRAGSWPNHRRSSSLGAASRSQPSRARASRATPRGHNRSTRKRAPGTSGSSSETRTIRITVVRPERSAADGVEVVGVAGDDVLDLDDVGRVLVAEEEADGPPDQLLVVHLQAELLAESGAEPEPGLRLRLLTVAAQPHDVLGLALRLDLEGVGHARGLPRGEAGPPQRGGS